MERYELKERGGVLRGEADAAVGDGSAEAGGIGRAVDVDEAGERVGIMRLQPVQGEDAGEDGILPPAGSRVEPHGDAGAEHGEQRSVFAVFGVDDKAAQGGAAAAGFAAGAGCAGAARCGEEGGPCGVSQLQPLCGDADVNRVHYSLFT